MKSGVLGIVVWAVGVSVGVGQPFGLTDSGFDNAEFRARFLASYGVNSEIEPTLHARDRVLYERIAPFLREEPGRAIAEVEAALGAEASPAFRFLLGNLYYQVDELEKAEANLRLAVAGFPDFRRAHRTLGLIQIREGRFGEAIESWLRVITLGGGDGQSYGLLGYAYLSEEKYASALPAYRMARMFKPDSRDFRRGEAQCLLATDRAREAIALFEELIAEEPEVGEYWLFQANALLRLEREAEAIVNLEVAHALGSGSVESRFLLGDLHLRQENHGVALEHYHAAIREPGEFRVERALRPLRHLLAGGFVGEAEEYLAAIGGYLPAELGEREAALVAVSRARVAQASGRGEEAREILLPLVKRDPLNGEAILFLAENFRDAGEFAEAEFYLQRLLSLPEQRVEGLLGLGRLEVNRGDLRKALEYLRQAEELEPRAGLRRYIEAVEGGR